MKKNILISILTLFCFGCSDKNKLSFTHQSVIKSSINYIKKNNEVGLKDCYLVDSRLSPIQFELFFYSENADFEKKFGEDYLRILKNIENDLNSNGIDKHDEFRTKFSSCSESEYIISFSRMSETYVMCYLSKESKSVSLNRILEKKYKFNSNEYYFFLFEFNSSGDIINVFENSITFG